MGWSRWPHSRCWSFHSGAIGSAGSSRGARSGRSRASWAPVDGLTTGGTAAVAGAIDRSDSAEAERAGKGRPDPLRFTMTVPVGRRVAEHSTGVRRFKWSDRPTPASRPLAPAGRRRTLARSPRLCAEPRRSEPVSEDGVPAALRARGVRRGPVPTVRYCRRRGHQDSSGRRSFEPIVRRRPSRSPLRIRRGSVRLDSVVGLALRAGRGVDPSCAIG